MVKGKGKEKVISKPKADMKKRARNGESSGSGTEVKTKESGLTVRAELMEVEEERPDKRHPKELLN